MAGIHVPRRQARAFDLAMAKRLGLDPDQVTDDFTANFATDEDTAKVTFTGSIYLPTDEVLAMFNGDSPADADKTDEVEALCILFHDAYEAAAIGAGWETQERSRKPWADVPEANKATMRATIRTVLASDWLSDEKARADERERVALAIEAAAGDRESEPDGPDDYYGMLAAARIARGGGE